MQTHKIGEYFSGAGGLALGALQAAKELSDEGVPTKVSSVWAVDSNEAACRTYRWNFVDRLHHNTEVICQDVRKITPEQLPDVRGFLFGFPCNDFSVVGEHKGTNGDYGPLYEEAVKFLRVKKPDWFVAENVSGIRSANSGLAFVKILAAFEEAGYIIYPHLYAFEQYGVPQTRHRVIVVGIRKGVPGADDFKIPAPLFTDPSQYKTAGQAFAEIPPNAPNQEIPKMSVRVQERLSYILPGQNAFNAKIPKALQLNVRGATLSHIYRKLDPNKPSYTLTANGGGGTHGYHWQGGRGDVVANRALTARERAKIQTFPDDFEFLGTPQQVRSQIGMAVPPEGAKHIFKALFQTLDPASLDTVYATVPSNIPRDRTVVLS